MPYSWDDTNVHTQAIVRALRPSTVCDIGAGMGKYARLVRATGQENGFASRITGVEIDPGYVEQFNLRAIYDELIVADAKTLIYDVRRRFDLVIIGDCLEHMKHSDGLDLIHYLIYRSGYILIVYPHELQQDDWEGHIHEAHISTWNAEEFRGMNCISLRCERLWLYLIKGYVKSNVEITEIGLDHIVIKAPLG